MLFSSATFLFFFLPFTLIGSFLLPRKARLPFLFACSLLFYGWGEPTAIALMLLSILFSYVAGLLMARMPNKKKMILIAAVSAHVLLLGFFKYAGMTVRTLAAVIPALRGVAPPEIALPIGISFYTFQSIAYCVDVYRGDAQAERGIVPFGTYISFFPQLIAGPIERYGDIRPQLSDLKGFQTQNIAEGARLFVIGLSKKLLLANPTGQMWEALSASPAQSGGIGCWAALCAFAFHIYFDFSGYSDMARGLGRMFGVTLKENFRYPYAANSVTDFWRRWHITLSSWFREYVYIPLGGNRRGAARQAINLLLVWLLTGLWHGAAWNFALWGLYYAVLLIAEKFFLLKWLNKCPALLRRALTLIAVLLGWAIFATEDLSALPALLTGLFAPATAWSDVSRAWTISYLPLLSLCAAACVPLAAPIAKRLKSGALQTVCLCALMLLCIASLASGGYNPFLYFRF